MLAEYPSQSCENGDLCCCGSNMRPEEPQTPGKKHTQKSRIDNVFSDVAEDVVICILSFLSPSEISACRCLNRRLHGLCSDDRKVWFAMCERRWGAKTEVKKWGNGKIKYRVLYEFLEKWENLVGFWRGVGQGRLGPLVTFDWGNYSMIGNRIIPVMPGSYEVRKVPFLWMGISSEGKGLCFIDPNWLLDSALGKNCRIGRGLDLFSGFGKGSDGGSDLFSDFGVGTGSWSASLAILEGGLGLLDRKMDRGARVSRIRNPFEIWEVEDGAREGLVVVNLSFVGNSHIVVEENQDRNWAKNCPLARSNSHWDLSKKKSRGLMEDGSNYGSLPDRLQTEICEYFASKVSLGGDSSVRKQRRKEKAKGSHGRRKLDAEHFVKIVNCYPTPACPLQGLWKGISDSMSLEFILVSYNECGGIVCKKVGGHLQNIAVYSSVSWPADYTSYTDLNFSAKEEELYNCRTHIRPMDDVKTNINKCTVYEEGEVTRVLCINSDSAGFRNGIGVSTISNTE
ncbi:hypothetical protein KI387_008224, partial [Taxus chinensis]